MDRRAVLGWLSSIGALYGPWAGVLGAPGLTSAIGTRLDLSYDAPRVIEEISPATQILRARLNGLRQFIRIDWPEVYNARDAPWVVFAHGRVGPIDAPKWRFNLGPSSYYGDLIEHFRRSGYVVVFPGYRGHGTVGLEPAEGIEYLQAFDNDTHLVPIFYALDLIAATLALRDRFSAAPHGFAHSQGADALLISLTLAHDIPGAEAYRPQAASLWSGTIAPRHEQFRFFDLPRRAPTVSGSDYLALAQQALERFDRHPWTRADAARWVGDREPYQQLSAIQTRLQIHYSDQDPYSPVDWNRSLFEKLQPKRGHAIHFYPDNTHEFELARTHKPTSTPGRERMIQNTIDFFRERSPHAESH